MLKQNSHPDKLDTVPPLLKIRAGYPFFTALTETLRKKCAISRGAESSDRLTRARSVMMKMRNFTFRNAVKMWQCRRQFSNQMHPTPTPFVKAVEEFTVLRMVNIIFYVVDDCLNYSAG